MSRLVAVASTHQNRKLELSGQMGRIVKSLGGRRTGYGLAFELGCVVANTGAWNDDEIGSERRNVLCLKRCFGLERPGQRLARQWGGQDVERGKDKEKDSLAPFGVSSRESSRRCQEQEERTRREYELSN